MASGLFHDGSDVVLKSTGLFREDLKLLIEEYLEGREVDKEFEWYPCRTLALYVKQVVAAFDEGCMHMMRLEPDVEYGPLVVPLVEEEFLDKGFNLNGFCFASESSSGNWNEGWFAGRYKIGFANPEIFYSGPIPTKQRFIDAVPALAKVQDVSAYNARGELVTVERFVKSESAFRHAILISEERAAHINKYFGKAKQDGAPFNPELAAKIVYGKMDGENA